MHKTQCVYFVWILYTYNAMCTLIKLAIPRVGALWMSYLHPQNGCVTNSFIILFPLNQRFRVAFFSFLFNNLWQCFFVCSWYISLNIVFWECRNNYIIMKWCEFKMSANKSFKKKFLVTGCVAHAVYVITHARSEAPLQGESCLDWLSTACVILHALAFVIS